MIWTLLLACSITATQGQPPLASAQERPAHQRAPDPALQQATAYAALQTWIQIPSNTAAQEVVLREIPLLREEIKVRWSEFNTDQQSWILDTSARIASPADLELVTEHWLVLPEGGRVMLTLDTPLPRGMPLIDVALGDPAPAVRIAAIRRLPLPAGEARLRDQLRDSDATVRQEARLRLGLPAESAARSAPVPTEP